MREARVTNLGCIIVRTAGEQIPARVPLDRVDLIRVPCTEKTPPAPRQGNTDEATDIARSR